MSETSMLWLQKSRKRQRMKKQHEQKYNCFIPFFFYKVRFVIFKIKKNNGLCTVLLLKLVDRLGRLDYLSVSLLI